jgi:hypothetical protein
MYEPNMLLFEMVRDLLIEGLPSYIFIFLR